MQQIREDAVSAPAPRGLRPPVSARPPPRLAGRQWLQARRPMFLILLI